mmetsp:Transcript_41222/g.95467  ORF Transcript_41222/g.95467 Transcript_41222/m.95467 type:complete len:183 (+) Transcript_41222:167-715(+)
MHGGGGNPRPRSRLQDLDGSAKLDIDRALRQVWQRQAARELSRPGEAHEALSSTGHAADQRRPPSYEHLERRCDEVLDRLVKWKGHAGHIGHIQDQQLRLRDENRRLKRHSSEVCVRTAQELSRNSTLGVPSGPFWSHVPPLYETTSAQFFGDKGKFEPYAWHGRYPTISQWGAEPSFHPKR